MEFYIKQRKEQSMKFYSVAEIMDCEWLPDEQTPGWRESLTAEEREVVDRLDRYNARRDRTAARCLAWPLLVGLEPRLAVLEAELASIAREHGEDPNWCANEVWYGYGTRKSYRDGMSALAGWSAERPALRTRAAYDLAYEYLYELLPGCRECFCA